MRDNLILRDIVIALLFVAAIVGSYYLVTVGFYTLMTFSFMAPAWLLLLMFFILTMKKKKK